MFLHTGLLIEDRIDQVDVLYTWAFQLVSPLIFVGSSVVRPASQKCLSDYDRWSNLLALLW